MTQENITIIRETIELFISIFYELITDPVIIFFFIFLIVICIVDTEYRIRKSIDTDDE